MMIFFVDLRDDDDYVPLSSKAYVISSLHVLGSPVVNPTSGESPLKAASYNIIK